MASVSVTPGGGSVQATGNWAVCVLHRQQVHEPALGFGEVQNLRFPKGASLVRQQTCPQQLAVRARIIVLAGRGAGVRPTAGELGIGRSTVQAWRRRWLDNSGASVVERLSDAPRPGTPATFTPEQVCGITALVCQAP